VLFSGELLLVTLDYYYIIIVLGFCSSLHLLYNIVVVSPGFDFVFLVLAKRLAGKSMPKMTHFMADGTLNH